MGKTNNRRIKVDTSRELTSNPFKGALKDFKIAGPSCICCQKELDTRLGRTIGHDRGLRQPLRQGYMCQPCETEQSQKYHKTQWKKFGDRYVEVTTLSQKLEVPAFSEDDLDTLISGQA